MKRGKPHLFCNLVFLLFLLAAIPAYCQRATFDINAGQVSDKFGTLGSVTGADFDVNGQVTVIHSGDQDSGPSIVAGGEVRIPADGTNHAKEFALYAGPSFRTHHLSIGFNAQVRKIYLPSAIVENQFFTRGNLELFQLPLVIRYTFGPARRGFIQVQGEPEFTPRYHAGRSLVSLPHPKFDHGYTVQGSVGYTFGKWYAKGTYETRYFKFLSNPGNPSDLFNWRSNLVSGGVGLIF